MSFADKAQAFLSQDKLAVVGVSRSGDKTGNGIFRALQAQGHEVYPVNPHVEAIEGVTCYPNVQSLPSDVGGVVIVTRPEITEQVVQDCAEAGIPRVWMHYNALFGHGPSSVSPKAVDMCREHNIEVIDGGCPMMFIDGFHKCMRWILGRMGKLPQ